MKKTHKVTNANTLRGLLSIDEKYYKENGEHCLTDKTREYIENVLSQSDDDFVINALFNKGLKTKMIGKR